MYFTNRADAGRQLAEQLQQYRYENSVVVALSEGSVLVGEVIAAALHCILTLLLAEDVNVPGEPMAIGSVDQNGGFSYNSDLSSGEVDEYQSEFFNYIEGQKLERFHHLNQLLGDGGVIDRSLLLDQNVILVSDGLKGGAILDAAANFLKPIRMHKLIIATPLASVKAVDRMHIMADELHVLSVTDNYLDTNHYYDDNVIPGRDEILAKIRQIILNWH
ncbi:MAG TPA: phosphoribosyltransferase family protein [Candidatus Saccharimonadales bacterium]|nr:phosphoribosyltransferase family protein [Candidatus Saccharimonadales bacterium]